jgi:hypothetical protein
MRKPHGSPPNPVLVGQARFAYLLSREVNEERFTKMFKQIKKLTGALRPLSASEREMSYLNASSDRIDLEYRQRQIDRGLFRNGF